MKQYVSNKPTNNMINYALYTELQLTSIPVYPRKATLLPSMGTWNAVLGTPIVGGTCWFLIQHQDNLGWKQITSIDVFLDSPTFPSPTVAIHLGPIPGGSSKL
jgi:hypothetical protein